jgi:hypothetical protein
MTSKEKVEVTPDPEKTAKYANAINKLLCDENAIVVDAMTAIISVMLQCCLGTEVTKGELLGYISNAWELNDPENDHPLREKMPKINF